MRFTQTCPECGGPYFYDAPDRGTLEIVSLSGGRCAITMTDSTGYAMVVHECADRGDGGSTAVAARPPRRPPGRSQAAARNPDDD